MRFGISIPQFVADGSFDAGEMTAYLERAEELGFEGGWVGEQVLGTIPHLGPIETLTWAAARTNRLRLGVSSLILPLYSPLHLAKSLASLDQLSRGRLDVGIALGGRFRQFAAFGVDPTNFVSRFTEEIRLLKAIWTEDRLDFDGRFFKLKNAAMEPKPFQKPHPPLWIGASHPNAVRRAVALGDAFMGAGSQTTEQFAQQVAVVREAASDRGGSFPIAKRVYIAVEDDDAVGRSRLNEGLAQLYGYFGLSNFDSLGVGGTPATCIAALSEVARTGAELILLNPLYDDRHQMERLAAEVVPALVQR